MTPHPSSQVAAQARRDDRGALTLGYVAVLPLLFLFVIVIVQASFWFLAKQAALAAARQGADAARGLGASKRQVRRRRSLSPGSRAADISTTQRRAAPAARQHRVHHRNRTCSEPRAGLGRSGLRNGPGASRGVQAVSWFDPRPADGTGPAGRLAMAPWPARRLTAMRH